VKGYFDNAAVESGNEDSEGEESVDAEGVKELDGYHMESNFVVPSEQIQGNRRTIYEVNSRNLSAPNSIKNPNAYNKCVTGNLCKPNDYYVMCYV
jgi:hypothetical protein